MSDILTFKLTSPVDFQMFLIANRFTRFSAHYESARFSELLTREPLGPVEYNIKVLNDSLRPICEPVHPIHLKDSTSKRFEEALVRDTHEVPCR